MHTGRRTGKAQTVLPPTYLPYLPIYVSTYLRIYNIYSRHLLVVMLLRLVPRDRECGAADTRDPSTV